jgi:hypothetical protein
LGSPAHVFANIANTATAVTTPMKTNTMLIIYAAFLAVWSKQGFTTEIVRLLKLQDVGYQGCCPKPAFAVCPEPRKAGLQYRYPTLPTNTCESFVCAFLRPNGLRCSV